MARGKSKLRAFAAVVTVPAATAVSSVAVVASAAAAADVSSRSPPLSHRFPVCHPQSGPPHSPAGHDQYP